MKQIFIAASITAVLFLSSCTGNAKDTNKDEVKQSTETVETKNSEAENAEAKKGAIHLTKAEFLQKVANYEQNPNEWVYLGDKPCIIDFYADWCRPCKIAGPILEELANEYDGEIYVYKIDTEKERELAGAFGIRSIPAFLFCPMNENPQMSAGIAQTPEETKVMFKKAIDEFLLKKPAAVN